MLVMQKGNYSYDVLAYGEWTFQVSTVSAIRSISFVAQQGKEEGCWIQTWQIDQSKVTPVRKGQ